ncbi:MAG TPA: M56 family metallopeptidase [Candidatus Tumulicola sp.]|nr:M56 family metallopeptidase [Candidatus Tumulicola sp.]
MLIAASQRPSARLALAASACGLGAREFDETTPVCALARSAPPLVLVSTGALAVLADEELRAALHHERAHARRGDQVVATFVTFMADVLPLPSAEFIAMYRSAREFAADQFALASTSAEHLAGALLSFAKGARAVAGAPGFADENAGVIQRLKALLADAPAPIHPNRKRTRILIAAAMAALFVAALATPMISAAGPAACPMPSAQRLVR